MSADPSGRRLLFAAVYRVALRAYPWAIRARFGDDMLACFEDLSRRARRERGVAGELVVFVRTLVELPRSALKARRVQPGVPGHPGSASIYSSKRGRFEMDPWIKDLRVAFRALVKRPGFSILAVLSLAIGVGANTTMFSTVNAVLWRQLPVPDPERLVRIYEHQESYSNSSYPNFNDIRERAEVFDGMFLHRLETFGLTNQGSSQIVYGEIVSASYFDVLGIQPAVGRFFSISESDFAGAEPVVVLSHSLWQRSFGGARDVVGQVIRLNNHAVTVVGVAPERFDGTKFGLGMDAWVPVKIWAQLSGWGSWTEQRGSRRMETVARLAPEATIEQAERSLAVIAEQLSVEYPETNRRVTFGIFPERNLTPEAGNLPQLIGLLAIGASGLVLLVACANVASLLFARGITRRKEFSVRLALGAGRARLIRQLLTESGVLALLGGTVGVALSFWTTGFIYLFLPSVPYRFVIDATPDLRVLAFASSISALALFAFGLTPALQASRSNAGLAMRSDTAGAGVNVQRVRMFDGVVVSMVAFSFITLLFSALFGKSLSNVRNLNPGFATTDRILATFDVSLGGKGRGEAQSFFEQLVEQTHGLPGVRNASVTSGMPLGDSHSSSRVYATDISYDADEIGVNAWRASVGNDYFATSDISMLRGRSFGTQDHADSPTVVVINEALADQVWGSADVVGRRLSYRATSEGSVLEVIGVIPTGRYINVGESPRPAMFFSMSQAPNSVATLMVHTDPELDALALRTSIARLAGSIDPTIPMFDVKSVEAHLSGSLWMFRLGAGVGAGMGLLALALAAGGLYGIMAFSVSQRLRELGIRVALGARKGQVLGLLLRKGLTLVGIGVVFGVALALGVSGFLASMLFGVQPTDPITFIAVAVGMLVVAALATIIPASAATRADPVTVLRSE